MEEVRVLEFSVEVEDEDSSSFFNVLQIFPEFVSVLICFGWREKKKKCL
jgi:hypothetical protein